MSNKNIAKINKGTLKFFIDSLNVPKVIISKKLGVKIEYIAQWIDVDSDIYPTINQAKNLALLLRVPFAGLYIAPENISKKDLPKVKNFRSFHDNDGLIDIALMDLIRSRDFYEETKLDFKEDIVKFDLAYNNENIEKFASMIRQYFDISIVEQLKKSSSRQFYIYLRRQVENKGIFIQGFRGINVEVLRGVAIFDKHMPIIGINDDDRFPGKSFSIIHEIVHLTKKVSSVCDVSYDSYSTNREEIFCNAIAGEVLVPKNEIFKILSKLSKKISEEDVDLPFVKNLAKIFSVSSEVITRRMLDIGMCSDKWYKHIIGLIKKEFNIDKQKIKENGKFYMRKIEREAFDRTSCQLSDVLYRGYYDGIFDKKDIANHIGTKIKHVDKFVSEVSRCLY